MVQALVQSIQNDSLCLNECLDYCCLTGVTSNSLVTDKHVALGFLIRLEF